MRIFVSESSSTAFQHASRNASYLFRSWRKIKNRGNPSSNSDFLAPLEILKREDEKTMSFWELEEKEGTRRSAFQTKRARDQLASDKSTKFEVSGKEGKFLFVLFFHGNFCKYSSETPKAYAFLNSAIR